MARLLRAVDLAADAIVVPAPGEIDPRFSDALRDARTILWNGPMGVFEVPPFAVGTRALAEAVGQSDAVTVIGGGDTVAAIEQAGYASRMTHISTGGGATLELLEGRTLPGVAALQDR